MNKEIDLILSQLMGAPPPYVMKSTKYFWKIIKNGLMQK